MSTASTSSIELNGALGLVILPDRAGIDRSYALAAEIMPPGSEYVLGAASLPHLTLYHGLLRQVDRGRLREILDTLRLKLVGKKFCLAEIVTFGGNFVFWNVDPDDPSRGLLQEAHCHALALSAFLNRDTVAKSISEEGLSLSPEELKNIETYGHPLVDNLFLPHITLGFDRQISTRMNRPMRREFRFQVEAVEFVRIGFPGRVEEIFDLT